MAAAPAGAQTVWELTPYRIQVILATGRDPELTPDLQADLAEDLLTQVDALVGARWDVSVSDARPALRRAMIRDIETVTVELLEEDLSRGEEPPPEGEELRQGKPPDFDSLDKAILLIVLPGPAGHRVVARELDIRTRQWSTPVSVAVWQPAKLCDAAFRALRDAFSPLAQIVAVDKEDRRRVTMRLRAAGFPSRDETLVMVRPGDVFRPVIRHNDRSGKLRAVNAIPWTFLTVEEVVQAGLTCRLHTGLRTPLSGRIRGRFEQLALGVTAPQKPTRLILRSRTDPDQVLPGYDVYSHPPDSKTTELVGRTDWEGSVVVAPGGSALRVLLVKNGAEFLARLPLVPGLEAEIAADIPNDDQRLEAEGFIAGLQEQLIDLVTRREVLLTQARKRIDERKLDEAAKLVRQLQGLESRDNFALHLAQEQKKIFSPDKLTQAKIDQMFSKTRKLVDEYLDPAAIDQLDRQLREAREAGKRGARVSRS